MGQSLGHFGLYLGKLLEAHQLSTFELAEATGLEPDFVFQLLDSRQILTADIAFLLAEVLGKSPLTLLEVQRSSALGVREQEKVHKLAA